MSEFKSSVGGAGDEKAMDVDTSPPPYQLSAQLTGHDHGVRDVAICDTSLIASCEERGKMHIFALTQPPHSSSISSSLSLTSPPPTPPRWTEVPAFTSVVHLSLTFVLECIRNRSSSPPFPPSSTSSVPTPTPPPYPPATFMSGGGDNTARPFTSNGSLLPPLTPHPSPVNSITVLPTGHIATGAWDGIVRVWDGAKPLYQVVGHQHATEVLSIDDLLITASANHAIHLIRDRRIVRRIEHAHEHTIRKLVRHPLGFASAGNDGWVKVWTLEGEEVARVPAHVGSEVKFVYGLTVVRDTDELVTCGEDMQVKVWSRGGQLMQVLKHPGPVRAVKAMDNGDLVTACTDRVVRLWTRDPARYAEGKEREEYDEVIQHLTVANMQAIDASTLPGEEALTVPGKKEGQVLVVNVDGKGPTAYQWSDEAATWLEVGSVMGKSNKQSVDGVEYDSVTTVFVSETQSVKLGVNRDDDPFEVADRFCALYDLPADVKGQIVAHVRPLTDEVAGAERKRREKEEAERDALKQVPGWKQGGLEVYATINAKGMRDKLTQANTALSSSSPSPTTPTPAAALTAAEMRTLSTLIDELADTKSLHVLAWSGERTRVVQKMLQWPPEWTPAVLDCVRVAMVSAGGVEGLGEDATVHRQLREAVERGGKEVHLTLYLKLFSNFIAKRKRGKGERASPPTVDSAVLSLVSAALGVGKVGVTGGLGGVGGEKVVEVYMLMLHNVVSWLGRLGVGGEGVERVEMEVVEGVVRALRGGSRGVKAEYYGLLCVGSVGYAVRRMRGLVMGKFGAEVQELVRRGKANDNQAVREVAADVERLFLPSPAPANS